MQDHQAYADWIKERRLTGRKSREIRARGGEENKEEKEEEEEEEEEDNGAGAGTRTNNKLNPHLTASPGIEPGPHWWKASALTTAPSLLSQQFTFTSQFFCQLIETVKF